MSKANFQSFDVIIIGGSYAGLSAAMALGRSLRSVLVIDGGDPCNRQTPRSHNFLTHDGNAPGDIAALAKSQVRKYDTVEFQSGFVVSGRKQDNLFRVKLESGEEFQARRLLFATGVRDILPEIPGFAECWGISILHCPYCHGFEVKGGKIAILGNGSAGFHLTKLIRHWSKTLTLLTNGPATLSEEETHELEKRNIPINEREIRHIENQEGYLTAIVFKDGSRKAATAVFAKVGFEQKSSVPRQMGCELAESGLIKVDEMQKTTVPGIYAAGDNASGMRAVALAVAAGTKTGALINHDLVEEEF